MKKLLFLTAVICVILIFGSCKKCIECTAYNRSNNNIVSQVEYCGRSNAIERQADSFEMIWTDSYYYTECR